MVIPKIIKSVRNSNHEKESLAVFENLKNFTASKYYLSTNSGVSVGIDCNRKLICLLDNLHRPSIFDFDQVKNCELLIDGESVFKTSAPEVIGRSIIGNVLAKEPGAIVGGTTSSMIKTEKIHSIRLKIIVSDIENPVFKVDFLKSRTDKGSFEYNKAYSNAEEWHALFLGIILQK
jgi:hypothetical protein